MLKRNKNTRLHIPSTILASTFSAKGAETPALEWALYFVSLFLREFLSVMCLLVLNSRLGGDLFIAGPIVTLYVSIVFRRPLLNPFVTTLACLSTGDWRNANVAGYPAYSKADTEWWELVLFWVWMVGAQLSGAAAAAYIRAYNDAILGYEFIKNAAWGAGQMHFRANLTQSDSCWNKSMFQNVTDIPVRLYRDSDSTALNDNCLGSIQWRWWFAEDLAAALFLIVGYIHIWRWLRWDDMLQRNPTPKVERYWEKIVTFSIASASLGMMTSIAFPTAHAGWHTSLFLYVYESAGYNKHVTSNALSEPLFRGLGGIIGCLLAVLYEWQVSRLESVKKSDATQMDNYAHKLLYIMPIPDEETEKT
jgi:hypothetical protein